MLGCFDVATSQPTSRPQAAFDASAIRTCCVRPVDRSRPSRPLLADASKVGMSGAGLNSALAVTRCPSIGLPPVHHR